jgi:hypothetical protein
MGRLKQVIFVFQGRRYLDFPVPSAMITVEAQRDNLVVKAIYQNVLGAISTLTKAKI